MPERGLRGPAAGHRRDRMGWVVLGVSAGLVVGLTDWSGGVSGVLKPVSRDKCVAPVQHVVYGLHR